MNFYKHYIGDFQRDTGHLSLTERGAYLALMHHYYATEKPLPNNIDALCRVAGAVTKQERQAVVVAMQFFETVESGLMHSRIEAELEKAGEISNTNRDIALAREAKRRAARTPKQEHEQSTNRAQSVPRTEHEQSTNHTPHTRHHINHCSNTHSDNSQEIGAEPADQARVLPHPVIHNLLQPGVAGSCCKAMISQGVQGCNPHHPILLALLEAGATEDEFSQAAKSAKDRGKANFSYVIGIVKRQREEAAKLVLHHGRLPNKQEALEESNRAATAGWVPPEMRGMQHAN